MHVLILAEISMRISIIAALVLGFAAVCAAQITGANWTYEGKTGPLVWGKLDPAYQACSKGHEQSPLDIRGAHLNKRLQPLEFHFIAGPMTLENTGAASWLMWIPAARWWPAACATSSSSSTSTTPASTR